MRVARRNKIGLAPMFAVPFQPAFDLTRNVMKRRGALAGCSGRRGANAVHTVAFVVGANYAVILGRLAYQRAARLRLDGRCSGVRSLAWWLVDPEIETDNTTIIVS